MKNFAIIIRGNVGAGKSTISSLLRKKLDNTALVDVDEFKHIIEQPEEAIFHREKMKLYKASLVLA